MMRRDSIFYRLFRQSPTLLFELLSQQPENAELYVFEAVEVKETSFRMDGVFLPPEPSGIVYVCEVQFQPDELLYERMTSEIGIYVYRNRERFIDWRAVVIYPSRSIEQSRTDTVREMLASGRIQRVYLDELGEIEELPISVGLMVLTTIEGDKAITIARSLIERAQGDSAEPTLHERDIIDLISTIIVYKFGNLTREEVDAMLGIELEQTRVYQEAKLEGEAIGEARGEARGKAEGKAEEGRSLVIRQLTRKLGNLTPQLQERVNSLQLDRIESLGEALLDFTSIADLENWLSQN
jgi:predicted transposase/invertase (TIGR01784 family)